MQAPSTFDPISPSPADVEVARKAATEITRMTSRGRSMRLVSRSSTRSKPAATRSIDIPAGAVPIIRRVLEAMAKGQSVSLVPVNAEVTTQQAADLLGVSRPFLIKVLERGELKHRTIGRHRRVMLTDLMAYKHAMQAARRKVLAELAEEGQRLGIGY